MALTEMTVDSGHQWWSDARAKGGWPSVLAPVVGLDEGHQSVVLDADQLAQALAWARSLPSYDDTVFDLIEVAWDVQEGVHSLPMLDVAVFEEGQGLRLDWTPEVASVAPGPLAQEIDVSLEYQELAAARAQVLKLHQGF